MEILKLDRADLDQLHAMICETIDASYRDVYPPRAVAFFKRYHAKKRILARSKIGETLVLVSRVDGLVVATGSLVEGEIAGVFVRPQLQRQGYRKTIMTYLEKLALEKGMSRVQLNISLPSLAFYEHLGYEILEERALHLGEGQYLRHWLAEKKLAV